MTIKPPNLKRLKSKLPKSEPVVEVRDPFEDSWIPGSPAQKLATESQAQFLLFGGAAGSLKSETLLVMAARDRARRKSNSVIIRKTFPELQQLIERSQALFSGIATYNDQKKMWRFASGAKLYFKHCRHDKEIYRLQGDEYNFIGIDESTHFIEKPVRWFINSRLRSSDPWLHEHRRVRLATNPGSVGHSWHQDIFMGKGCSHCKSGDGIREPGQMYFDARWPSDNRPINFSTQFIPGRLTDHQLLGEDYAKQLEGLPAAYAKALKEGCWDLFVGQYFDCWNRERMVVPRQAVRNEFWWSYWIGIDYGFSGSAAVAYLLCKSPSGVSYVIGELAKRRMMAKEFGEEIKLRWIDPFPERRLKAGYLSPDAWERTGTDGHTLADQIQAGSGMRFEKASNNRVSGAMLLYTALDHNELKIADTCELLIKTIPTRVHDEEKNPDDVLKVKDDPRDDSYDSCIAKGSRIATERGDVPIEDVAVGERVWTRKGLRAVLSAGITNPSAATLLLETSRGDILEGTGNHPVWTNDREFIRLDALRYGDILGTCKNRSFLSLFTSLFSTALSFVGIRWPRKETTDSISLPAKLTLLAGLRLSIAKYGSFTKARFQTGITSIIKIATRCTTILTTSNASAPSSMRLAIDGMTLNASESTCARLDQGQYAGTSPQPRNRSTLRSESYVGRRDQRSQRSVGIAAISTRPAISRTTTGSAPTHASLAGAAHKGWMMLSARVKTAVDRSNRISTTMLSAAPVRVERVCAGRKGVPVYNLEVEGEHEYFANGILVHNCRYAWYSWISDVEKPRGARIEEAVTSDDPTVAALQRRMAEERLDKVSEPVSYRNALPRG